MKFRIITAVTLTGLLLSGCTSLGGEKQSMGTFLGGATGAVVGSQFGGGNGRLAATAVGAILGAAIGNDIGQSLDEVDRMKSQQAFNMATKANLGSTVTWNNPRTGHHGTVVPVRDGYSTTGEYCREFQQTVDIGGRKQTAYGTACRMGDGQWRITN